MVSFFPATQIIKNRLIPKDLRILRGFKNSIKEMIGRNLFYKHGTRSLQYVQVYVHGLKRCFWRKSWFWVYTCQVNYRFVSFFRKFTTKLSVNHRIYKQVKDIARDGTRELLEDFKFYSVKNLNSSKIEALSKSPLLKFEPLIHCPDRHIFKNVRYLLQVCR